MSNTVFILGAGASCEYGLPLISNFLEKSRELYNRTKADVYKDNYERVIQTIGNLQNVNSKSFINIYNIEEVLSAFEMGRIINKLPGISKKEEIEHIVESTKRLIYETLDKSTELKIASRSELPDAFSSHQRLINFIDRKNKENIDACSIITFNYDLLLDYALYKQKLNVNYCLDEVNKDKVSQVKLMKLHGSLNWFTQVDEKNDVVPLYLDDIFKDIKYYFNPGGEDKIFFIDPIKWLSEKNNKYNEKNIIPEPILVPPTFNKIEYNKSILNVWRQTSLELTKAENILICGYSHPETDNFFKYLFALGISGESIIKRIVVYDPDQGVNEKYKKILGRSLAERYIFKETYFQSFVEDLDNILER
jgi:NAD-dependent SIR2 family protein deacetylase